MSDEIKPKLVPCHAAGEPSDVLVTGCLGRVRLGSTVGVSHHFTPRDARRLAELLVRHADEIDPPTEPRP